MRTNLINARKQSGLTQVDVATQIGVTERTYQSIESGATNSRLNTWTKLSTLFDKPVDELILNYTDNYSTSAKGVKIEK